MRLVTTTSRSRVPRRTHVFATHVLSKDDPIDAQELITRYRIDRSAGHRRTDLAGHRAHSERTRGDLRSGRRTRGGTRRRPPGRPPLEPVATRQSNSVAPRRQRIGRHFIARIVRRLRPPAPPSHARRHRVQPFRTNRAKAISLATVGATRSTVRPKTTTPCRAPRTTRTAERIVSSRARSPARRA